MLTKNDLALILTEMENNGVEGSHEQLLRLFGSVGIPMEPLRFIASNRHLDVIGFYDLIRRNHNEKRSSLYKNIVKDIEDPTEAISTLSAFALQLFLYSKHIEDGSDKAQFYRQVRAEEVTRVLNMYYRDFDVTSALKMLRLIKADILALEEASGRR